MALSDSRHVVVDLTTDTDDEEPSLTSPRPAKVPTRRILPSPASARVSNTYIPPARPTRDHVPLPGSTTPNSPHPLTVPAFGKRTPNGPTPTSSSRPLTATSSAAMGRSASAWKSYVPMPASTENGASGGSNPERAVKRMRVTAPGEDIQAQAQRATQQATTATSSMCDTTHGPQVNGGELTSAVKATQTQSRYRPGRTLDTSARLSTTNKLPSVQDMNAAFKRNGSTTTIPYLGDASANEPRALKIGQSTQEANLTNLSSMRSQVPATATLQADKQTGGNPQVEHMPRSMDAFNMTAQTQAQRGSTPSRMKNSTVREAYVSRPSYFSGPTKSPRHDERDSVMLDASPVLEAEYQQPTDRIALNAPSTSAPISTLILPSTTNPSKSSPGLRKFTNQFSKEEDHYLIFLKEVKQHQWRMITTEFNKEFTSRQYSALQSRYSTYLNKRDRSQDPAVLSSPLRFAAEVLDDWQTVHANNPGPRAHVELTDLRQDAALINQVRQPQHQDNTASLPFPVRQTTEQDYSSGTDSAPRRERSHRAKRINYTWPKHHRRTGGASSEEVDVEETFVGDLVNDNLPARSETPAEDAVPIPEAAVAVVNDPINMNYAADDAKLALTARKGPRTSSDQPLPYLDVLQRLAIHEPPADWKWDQLSSRQWQGCLLHVDFSPSEIEVVEKAIAQVKGSSRVSRHSTKRRQLRDLLKDITEPKFLQLICNIRRRLPRREKSSIVAFLQDARTDGISDAPQIQRFAAARPNDRKSTSQTLATSFIIRQRELGQRSRRGWQAPSKPLTYPVKNKYMDTLGPAFSWTGASSDVHTVAWAPDGEYFAAGAVAVDDPDSMQYNRPNNLLYGDTSRGVVHELGEHTRFRERTETGANSSHAMFVSQDPKLYTTVSSVAFATSGKLMYSAGYDETLCVWHTDTESTQPILVAKLNTNSKRTTRAPIDIMTINRKNRGVLATAAKTSSSNAVRLLTLDEEDPLKFQKHNFHSTKAVSRTDLKILPTALQFEPSAGRLLLAGFGANMRDSGFDITGDLCLWDVETQIQLSVHGSNKNVFDVEFNPKRSYMPLFAVGCVAGANVNKGTRSLLRLYDENGPVKFRCPLEIECKALDMNDVVWCPHNEYLIAAGCTDGRAYVWDVRWPIDPIRTLSHGRSLMPLQDGVHHEVTDTGMRFLSWGENATRLYSGSSDGVIKVWDVTRSEENTFIKDLVTVDSGIMSGAFSPDMSKLVIGEVNGSVNVLEVGRDDCSIRDAAKLRYVPYEVPYDEDEEVTNGTMDTAQVDSGIAEANHLLQTGQINLAPFGGLPVRQAVQGLQYIGPFDQGVNAPYLREQALEFQLSMAGAPGSQCNIAACKDIVKITSEETGDSGRSADRIPDDVRRQWKAIDSNTGVVPGKAKCTHCGRPARPSFGASNPNAPVLCERCSFACFRCGADNPIAAATSTLICDSCAGVWDIGSLGYECAQQPKVNGTPLDVPSLKRFGKERYLEKLERLEDIDSTFGDEMNALTDYYYSLAVARPESPSR